MKPEELRIGNLISYFKPLVKNPIIDKILGIVYSEDYGCMIVVLEKHLPINIEKGIMPIPLTEKWLLKFGFEHTQIQYPYVFGNGKIGIFFHDGFVIYDRAKIQYIHQLQNLYFALIGEELEYVK